ncbi:MAG: sugar transferase [Salinivirgaceae bacterium]|nr:sugar transferase [Salinivirgaceae bacterium]
MGVQQVDYKSLIKLQTDKTMYLFLKRLFDILLSLIALILLSPLLIPVLIILLFTGEHYIFYKQKRVGYKNKRFQILKFATMLKNSPNMTTGSITVRNDPRVFPFGKFLRKTKINELPQIFNVLLGNMSIVGPRPQMEPDFYRFPKHIQEVIYNAKPGITGIGSIVFRDEEGLMADAKEDVISFYESKIAPYKGDLEIWYQKNASLWTDLKIIFLTAWVIVFPKSNLAFSILKVLPQRPDYLND